MRFRKSADPAKAVPFPGRDDVLDGYAAIAATERLAGDVLVVTEDARASGFPVPVPVPTFAGDPAAHGATADASGFRIVEAADESDVAALLTGFALQGMRVSGLAGDGGGLEEALAAAAGKGLPIVVHLAARARTRQASASRGSHDVYHAVADTGAFLMFASNPQEAADYALIAHRVAERALTPGVCAQDLGDTTHSVSDVSVADDELIANYLGRPADMIATPTDAQQLLFGNPRRRVPMLLDPDHPAGIGGAQDGESHFRALAARRAYFSNHLADAVDTSLTEFAALTGREYARAAGYRADDAKFIVLAQGALVDELRPVVDHLRTERKLKVGVVNIAVLRPFPGAAVSHLLAGKRAVTILERCDAPLAEDAPLLRDIRGAIDRATENGAARGTPIHAGYATCRRMEERPALLSGVYGIGSGMPSFAQLIAVFENMTHDDARRTFYVGAGFDVETRRFPHLQTLRQRLDRAYPSVNRLSLEASTASPATPPDDGGLELDSFSAQGALFAGNLFARALAGATGWAVRTWPEGGLEHSLQPVRLGLSFRARNGKSPARPASVDTQIVVGEPVIETIAARRTLRHGGHLIVGSVREAEDLWRGLSQRAANWIEEETLSLHLLDARRIARETAAHASFIDQLSIWALLGAYTRVRLGLDDAAHARIDDHLQTCLASEPGLDAGANAEILRAFRRGMDECAPVVWKEWLGIAHPVGEPETPWTVRELTTHDGTVFDAARFWHSVGYLYDRGQSALTLADPYLGSAILPARSSAFRDVSPLRLLMPAWIPGNCTGCGACWTQCPESALPSTVRTLTEWIEAAAGACERSSGPLIQLKRMTDNLAKQAQRVVAQGGPTPFETLPAVLTEAFTRLVDKSGLDGDRLVALRGEFDRLVDAVDGYPVARTEAFFRADGTGGLLSIALNPLSCTACGICVTECPESALEWAAQSPERLATARRNWDFTMALGAPAPETITARVDANDPATQVNRLLDPTVYHSLVGGDGSFPGNGAKTAVHLVTATIESVMRPRFAAHVTRLSGLITRIEDQINGNIRSSIRVNDFDEFSRRLQLLERKQLTAAGLMEALGEDKAAPGVDATRLASLTQVLHDLKEQRESYATAAAGTGRARMVITIDPEVGGLWNGTYPYNAHPQPWAASRAGDALAMAAAVADSLARRTAREIALCRRAELVLQNADNTEPADGPVTWEHLDVNERGLVPRVLVITQPGCLDNGAVWNTLAGDSPVLIAAVDGSGIALPSGTADPAARIESAMRTLAQSGRFVAQTSIGAPGHLMGAVADALSGNGPALLRVYAPDPVACGVAPEQIASLARIAVESRAVPVFVATPDAPNGIDLTGNPDIGRDWTRRPLAVSGSSGVTNTIETSLTVAGWAVRQARFRAHFRVMSRGHRGQQTRPLADFIALAPDAREGLQPYIDIRDRDGQHAIAFVSREMTALVERAGARWRRLCDGATQAGARPSTPAAIEPVAAAASTTLPDPATLRMLTENLLRMSGFGSDDPLFKRSLREFVARERTNGEDDE
ncbi:MAG TPA: hypothetical protein VFX92_12015 [Candidatus Krumholzibacteria bacterium]|nr:hypothetical protein [Candidatus Krumholzibacteria bacterium]